MPEISMKGYQCSRCNHVWVPREKDVRPIVCPKCKSPYWDRSKSSGKKKFSFKEKKRMR